MSSHKHEHLEQDVKKELSAMLRELKDPRLKGTILSVVNINLSNDLSHCKVYISSVDGIEKATEATAALTAAHGLIKHEVFTRLSMRKCPEFKFIPDDSVEYSAHISKLLDEQK